MSQSQTQATKHRKQENSQNKQKTAEQWGTGRNKSNADKWSVSKSKREKENVPALHHKSYEAKHDGSRNVNNNNNLKSRKNMSKTKRYARVAQKALGSIKLNSNNNKSC